MSGATVTAPLRWRKGTAGGKPVRLRAGKPCGTVRESSEDSYTIVALRFWSEPATRRLARIVLLAAPQMEVSMTHEEHRPTSRLPLFAVLGVVALLAVPGCKGCQGGGGQEGQAEIVVGSLLALTGQHQSFGITQQRGMDIALEELNAGGGVSGRRIRVVYADTRLEEELGLQEYNRLTQDQGVRLIVGVTGSGVALRLASRANRDRVVLLDSIDTSPRLTEEGGDYFFRNIASDSYSGGVLAKWAIGKGHRKAALVYNSEVAWATGCRSAVEAAYTQAGGQLVLEPIAVVDSTDNFTGPITLIRRAQPSADAVFVCLMGRQGGLFASQAVANALNVPFYGTDPFSQQEFIDNAGDALSKGFFVLPAEGQNERYRQFAAKYRERFNGDPDTIAAKAYDSVYLLAEALRSVTRGGGEITGPRVRDALVNASIEGATGPNAFDTNGDLREALFDRYTYQNRQRVRVE